MSIIIVNPIYNFVRGARLDAPLRLEVASGLGKPRPWQWYDLEEFLQVYEALKRQLVKFCSTSNSTGASQALSLLAESSSFVRVLQTLRCIAKNTFHLGKAKANRSVRGVLLFEALWQEGGSQECVVIRHTKLKGGCDKVFAQITRAVVQSLDCDTYAGLALPGICQIVIYLQGRAVVRSRM